MQLHSIIRWDNWMFHVTKEIQTVNHVMMPFPASVVFYRNLCLPLYWLGCAGIVSATRWSDDQGLIPVWMLSMILNPSLPLKLHLHCVSACMNGWTLWLSSVQFNTLLATQIQKSLDVRFAEICTARKNEGGSCEGEEKKFSANCRDWSN